MNTIKMHRKRGISLIVLIITIIVIIILAAAVILTINNNNPMSNANHARYESDRANIQNALSTAAGSIMADKLCKLTIPQQFDISSGILYTLSGANDGVIGGKIGWEKNATDAPAGYEKTTNLGMKMPIYTMDTKWETDFSGNIILTVGDTKYGPVQIDYIKDGLILHLDGQNNTGTGHSNNTNTWVDLSENGNNGTLGNITSTSENAEWTENSLLLKGENFVSLPSYNNSKFTLELVYKGKDFKETTDTAVGTVLLANYESGGCGLEYSNANKKVFLQIYKGGAYHGLDPVYGSIPNIEKNKIYYSSASFDGSNIVYKQNQDIVQYVLAGSYSYPLNNTIWMVGSNPNGNKPTMGNNNPLFNGEIYSVRIYNRALTQEEMEHNYQVDKQKFGI